MTKAEIVDHVYDKVGGFSKKEATDLVDLLFEILKDKLKVGTKIKLSGFGNFVVRVKKSRWGLNPRTKERITLPARRVVRFKPSPVLKSHVNAPLPPTSSPTAPPSAGAALELLAEVEALALENSGPKETPDRNSRRG